MNSADCQNVFQRMLNREPYDYQVRAWEAILACSKGDGPPVLIEAPTAAGKTEAAITPYLAQHCCSEYPISRRLVYVLPSRSLVEAQARRIRDYGEKLGLSLSVRVDHGAAGPLPMFFGGIVVTTWDSFLYGLVGQRTLPRRFTIPAGNIATSMVVFDEVQMYQDGYFYTQRLMGRAAAILKSAGIPLVFMTATLSRVHQEEILSLQGYHSVTHQTADARRPVRGNVEVMLAKEASVYDLLKNPEVRDRLQAEGSEDSKGLIVVNTVDRAVQVYKKLLEDGWPPEKLLLLHSRFLAGDRRKREEKLVKGEFSLLVATQVVEAGLDISGVTTAVIEAAPPDALIQRIGRVARRPGETGMVWVVKPREPGGASLSLSPYAFVSEARINDLKQELAFEKLPNRDKAVGKFALTINETMREAMTQPGTEQELQRALTNLESSQQLVDPFYQKLWSAWRKVRSGQSRRAWRAKRRKAGEPGQQVLASVASRIQRVIQFEAAAGTYLAELVPFSLPPEGVPIYARPDFYVTGVFIPDNPSWADAQACLKALLEGQNNEREFDVGTKRIAELLEEFALNLNYTLVHIPDTEGRWQVRQELAFGEYTVLLERRWDRMNRNAVKWFLRRQPRTNRVWPMNTLVVPAYDLSLGLVLNWLSEDDGD